MRVINDIQEVSLDWSDQRRANYNFLCNEFKNLIIELSEKGYELHSINDSKTWKTAYMVKYEN